MRPLRVSLGGRIWRVVWCGRMTDYGQIEYGSDRESRVIRVRKQQTDHELLDTLIHEALHAQMPEVEEATIDQRAGEIAALVQRVFDLHRRVRKPRGK